VNRLAGNHDWGNARAAARTRRRIADGGKAVASASGTRHRATRSVVRLVPADPSATLFVIPCSGAKRSGGKAQGPGARRLIDSPTPALARELRAARAAISRPADLDESRLMPAWQRYRGALYEIAASGIEDALTRGLHLLIISGGYGVVLAGEPIGHYQARFRHTWWPGHVVERALAEYVRHHGLRAVRAFASLTTAYRTVIERTDWRGAGVRDAVLVCPEVSGGGALRKSPQAQGLLLEAALAGRDVRALIDYRIERLC